MGQRDRSVFGFARLLIREHGRRQGGRADGSTACCRRVVVPKREAFGRQWDAVQEFFAHGEKHSERNLAGNLTSYRNLEEFE